LNSFIPWVGGKGKLLWIINKLMPDHYKRFIDVFGGSGTVTMSRPIQRGCMEVYNDYNGNLTNLFCCVKNRTMALLAELGFLPLNTRDDFNVLYKFFSKDEITDDYLQEEMDLTALYATYERMPSEKYASPEIMLKIMLYAYHERKDVSSRTIEKNCKRDINYMYLLEGRKAPDHAAIARFRSKHFAKCARHFMAQMTKFLIKLEQVTTTEVFIDGTKIESMANRYTFVWKTGVEKNLAKLKEKAKVVFNECGGKRQSDPKEAARVGR